MTILGAIIVALAVFGFLQVVSLLLDFAESVWEQYFDER